ncbi:Antitoxin CptB [compost metagenome]
MVSEVSEAMQTEDEILLKKLRWRCRRGMRELDQLFGRYLDRRWVEAPEAERAVFLQLLESEDDKLWRWSMGYEACPDAPQAQLLEYIRSLPV